MDKKTFILIDKQRQDNAVRFLEQLPCDGSVEVVFQDKTTVRSLKQNAALWACAYPPVMLAMGMRGEKEREEIHQYFLGEYFGWKKYSILGKAKVKPVRTTTTNEAGEKNLLTKLEMADFYNFIQQRAADNGIYVPDPDPMYGIEVNRR